MGVEIVEIDLQRTKDGQLILMHDSKLNRTTTGKGRVADWTLDSIKTLKLKNGCAIKTIYTVPTLEEVLLLAKGRVMLNLDKAFDYFDQVYALLEKTGTVDMVIMKSDAPAQEVKKQYGKYLDKVVFMPKVNLDAPDAMQKLDNYLAILRPAAIEFKFASDTNRLPYLVKEKMQGKSRIWYNTLWNTQTGGHDDDCSLIDANKGYGYLIDSLEAGIIQTDRPAYLKNYLNIKKMNITMKNCVEDIIFRDGASEYQPETSPKFTVMESFLKGKKSEETNEDGILVLPDFAAVIDGATAKSDFRLKGKTPGRLAMELVLDAIRAFPADIDAQEAVNKITEKIHSYYVAHHLLEVVKSDPAKRFTANGVIYSVYRKEVWQIGDCQCIVGNLYSSNEKEIDGIMANARAAFNEVALLNGITMEDLIQNDPGRNFIKPFLQKQAILQNNPEKNKRFTFPVFDGFSVNMEQVNIFSVGNATQIILSSDGYPRLYSSLFETECYLKNILEIDPLCFRMYKSTKGIICGNFSFDDRAYLKIKLN